MSRGVSETWPKSVLGERVLGVLCVRKWLAFGAEQRLSLTTATFWLVQTFLNIVCVRLGGYRCDGGSIG